MKKITAIVSIFCALGSAMAAASPATLTLESKFNADEVKWVKNKGGASVNGTAFLKLKDSTLKGCAGSGVELLPVSAYANERIFKTYGNNNAGQILVEDNPPKFTPDVKEYHEMVIKSSCDTNNEFVFNNISEGEYYVMAFIIWDEVKDGNPITTGGAVMKKIKVAKNSKNKISL